MNPRLLSLVALLAALPLFAQTFSPPAQKEKATRGDALLTDYFRNETALLAGQCLAGIKTAADWNKNRDEYRRQLQEMLGLLPMPERTELKAVVTGRLDHDEFTVEKLQFQASPGLYCTASLFIPKNLTKPAPTILYRCGHWKLVKDGISYGNKAAYQMDGAWYARNGYVCMVLDTLLAGEIQGIHTGTRDHNLWWWNSRGYTPAGVEAWFGIRALDYLSTRPEVDANRFGVTGHSGGGAYSWTLTALDDRIKAAAPLAGITDLKHHIVDNLMDSHCDCNFQINTYRWDFPQLAAFAAPRPLLIGGTDNDGIFPLEGTMAIYEPVARIYKLLNASSNLSLVIAPGPHDEVPELRLAVIRWFNKHLKGIAKTNEPAILVDAEKFFTPEQLKVFTILPADAINTNIADTFVPKAESRKQKLEMTPDTLRAALREKVFAGWPAEGPPPNAKQVLNIEQNGLRLTAWDFESQHDVPLRLYLVDDATNSFEMVRLEILDEQSSPMWLHNLRAGFGVPIADEPADTSMIANIASPLVSLKAQLQSDTAALAWFAPRGVGMTAWSGDAKRQTRIRRRFALLGQTLDAMRVWDIRRAIQALHYVRPDDKARVELVASGTMAVNSLYAALYEPNVRKLDLANLPGSHTDGPDYLGILKITDIPQVRGIVDLQVESTTR
ncbi:MAG TPA: alpha/beta hydrolase family protein [Verrucomicrobiota bacterium]|nr:alpha/beta hydrolase family protein [Verrucomicrobiota bacterium]